MIGGVAGVAGWIVPPRTHTWPQQPDDSKTQSLSLLQLLEPASTPVQAPWYAMATPRQLAAQALP